MTLGPGTRIGAYQIVSAIGEGAMGAVYRARDTKLNRDVALKVLPDQFADDADRFARFTREAQTLAALNHPNIAQIYQTTSEVVSRRPGTESTSEVVALVMELVDGQDLADLIARGPLPEKEALAIARQIADALEAAHEQGIVHRDLKPANVKVRADGTVKVIDFGLAKSAGADRAATDAPTITSAGTVHGMILGTPAYMSPEQARGQAVDRRADIWAFGCVLYEMLTGARAFGRESISDTIAAVVRREIDWTKLPREMSPRLRHLLERCLDPDVKQRLRDIGEARVTIAAIERGDPEIAAVSPITTSSVSSRERFAWALGVFSIVIAAAFFAMQRGWIGTASSAGTPGAITRLSALPPPELVINPESANSAISPNGRMVAFATGSGGVSTENQLWVRSLDSPIARRIESGDGVSLPFWSPDSSHIGFFANKKLRIVAATGGPAEIVCDAPFGRGATWNTSNVIVFAPDASGPLVRISASAAGTAAPVPLTTLDATRQETGHRFPIFLPDGDHFLYMALSGTGGLAELFAGSLTDAHLKTHVASMESAPAYAPPGWLLFTRQDTLTAQAFDAKALTLTGDPISLGDEPGLAPGAATYEAGRRVSASTTGTLAFVPDPGVNSNLEWRDLTGKLIRAVSVPPGRYTSVAISPDATRAVLMRREAATASSLWIVDLTRASAVPLVTSVARNTNPIWSPDGAEVAFKGGSHAALYAKAVANASPERMLYDQPVEPDAWWKDEILINQIDPGTKWNVYRLPTSGTAAPTLVVGGPAIEIGGSPSPDGHWLFYLTDEARRLDLFVQSYPDGNVREQIATGNIERAWWERDGRSLLFQRRDKTLWRVSVDLRSTPHRIGTPEQIGTFPPTLVFMDIVKNGDRVLAVVPDRSGIGSITILQGWKKD